MAEKVLIKLKNKPKKPARWTYEDRCSVEEGARLSQVLEYFHDVDPKDIRFEVERETGYYNDYVYYSAYFVTDRPVSDDAYNAELERYEKKLERYKKWYAKNEETILAEKARRQQEAEEKKKRYKERERKSLERERKQLERRLRVLNKDLKN